MVLDNLFKKKILLDIHQGLLTLNVQTNNIIFDNTRLHPSQRNMHTQLYAYKLDIQILKNSFLLEKKKPIFK